MDACVSVAQTWVLLLIKRYGVTCGVVNNRESGPFRPVLVVNVAQ